MKERKKISWKWYNKKEHIIYPPNFWWIKSQQHFEKFEEYIPQLLHKSCGIYSRISSTKGDLLQVLGEYIQAPAAIKKNKKTGPSTIGKLSNCNWVFFLINYFYKIVNLIFL